MRFGTFRRKIKTTNQRNTVLANSCNANKVTGETSSRTCLDITVALPQQKEARVAAATPLLDEDIIG